MQNRMAFTRGDFCCLSILGENLHLRDFGSHFDGMTWQTLWVLLGAFGNKA